MKGTCSSGSEILISGDVATEEADLCVNGLFDLTVTLSGIDGNKTVLVTETLPNSTIRTDQRVFIKDTIPPKLDLLNIAQGAFVGRSLQLSGACENGYPIQVTAGTLNSTVVCQSGMYNTTIDIRSLPEGNFTASVSQTDSAGLKTLIQRALKKDATSPLVNMVSPAGSSAVASPFIVSGTCESNLTITITSSSMQSPASASCNNATFTATIVVTPGVLGLQQFTASQTDAGGNTGSHVKTFDVVESTIPPINVTISSPPANTATQNNLALSGSCQNGLPVLIEGTNLQTTTADCAGNKYTATILLAGPDGTKQIKVSQSESTSGAKGSVSLPYLLDTTSPVLSLSNPVENAPLKDVVILIGACETGTPVNISGTGIRTPTSVICNNSVFLHQGLFLSDGDGIKQILIEQTDKAGNSAKMTRLVLKDTTAPALSITSPAEGSTHDTGLTLMGSCESNLTVTTSGSAIKTLIAAAQCLEGQFSLEIQLSDGDGTKIINLKQTDASGNSTTVSRSFVKKTVVTTPTFVPPFTSQRTLTVCPLGCMYNLPSQAIAASQDFDLIEIRGGTYVDCAAIDTNKIWIKGVGSRPHLKDKVCLSKGIFVTRGSDITIENLEFSGMKITAAEGNNAAGIRGEGQKLTVRNSFFHDGQNGILGGATPVTGEVLVQNSHFARLGDSGYEHDIYINNIARFTLENSIVEEGNNGNLVKTRSSKTNLQCNKIMGGYNSAYAKAGYAVNLPNGGEVILRNNLIAQGLFTTNRNLMDFGSEGLGTGVNTLSVSKNILINDASAATIINMFAFAQLGSSINDNVVIGPFITLIGGTAAGPISNTNNPIYPTRLDAGLTQQFPMPVDCIKTVGLIPVQ